MADEEKQTLADDEEVTEPLDEEAEIQEDAETETEDDVQETEQEDAGDEEKWKTRHRTPDEVFEENRRLQSELAKARNQFQETSGVHLKEPEKKSSEDLLREFAADPQGFIDKQIAPLKGKENLNDFLSDSGNAERFGPYRNELVKRVGGDMSKLSDPMLMKAAFLIIEDEFKSAKLDVAGRTMQKHKESVTNVKKSKAFTEGSSTASSKKTAPTAIKPGMSQAEMDAILDAQGVPMEDR